jgi:surfeit locus 1 family protein
MFAYIRRRFFVLLATIVVIVVGLLLAQWQTRRAAEKEAIHAVRLEKFNLPLKQFAAGDIPTAIDRRFILRGHFVDAWPLYLDNRSYQGRPGRYVLMPFKVEGLSRYVMVARGWTPLNVKHRNQLQVLPISPNLIEIEGVVRTHLDRVLELGSPQPLVAQAIVQNVELAAFEKASGLMMYPFFVEQISPMEDGLIRDWPNPAVGVEKHKAYAFQWYALSLMAFIFFIVTGYRSGKEKK